MENISAKKKKNVQPATEQKSEASKPEANVPTVVIEKPEVHVEAPKQEPTPSFPSIKDVLQNVNPKTLKMASEFGIPLQILMQWAVGMETKQEAIIQVLKNAKIPTVDEIATKIMEKAQAQRSEQVKQAQANPGATAAQGGAGGIGQILDIINKVMGEGSNPMQEKMNQFFGAVLDKAIAQTLQPSRFEALLDEELMKAKAKAVAAVVTSGK